MTRTRKALAFVTPAAAVTLVAVVPLKIESGMNHREHHYARAARVKREHAAVWATLIAEFGLGDGAVRSAPLRGAILITLTRLGGRLWDDDNNQTGLKACRDTVSQWLGRNDGDVKLTWLYAQEPGPAWGVRIEIHAERGAI